MSKTVEFGLPTGATGMAAQYTAQKIRKNLLEWSDRYSIDYETESCFHSYRHWLRVKFCREEDVTVFFLTWNHSDFMRPEVVAEKGSSG